MKISYYIVRSIHKFIVLYVLIGPFIPGGTGCLNLLHPFLCVFILISWHIGAKTCCITEIEK